MVTKRIVFTRVGQVEIQTADTPLEIAASTEVLVRNRYSLVSAGTELACLAGLESWFALPGTPGYIAVGEVLAVGSAVSKVRPGDVVYTYGPHAQFFKIDTSNRWGGVCLKLPTGLAPDLATFTRMATIALTSVRVSEIELGDVVLVAGLGQVGNFAGQLAGLQGARVIGADISEKRRQAAQACGLAYTVDPSRPEWKKWVREITGGVGVSTLIDATGLSSAIVDASDTVALNGEVILLGSPRAPHSANVTDVFRKIHLPPSVTLKGALEWRYPTFQDEFVKHSVERNAAIVMDLLVGGRLLVAPLYTHKVSPDKAQEMYAGLQNQKDDFRSVVFDWTA
ncbi:alcohol dehydrogenase [Opitutaceae bacterium EW11]|nr:alcohol dehydrogenase [Opitutaceae bacterium EW11]